MKERNKETRRIERKIDKMSKKNEKNCFTLKENSFSLIAKSVEEFAPVTPSNTMDQS